MMKPCAWCAQGVHPEDPSASRGDGAVWHVACFVNYLAHKDELAGIQRRGHQAQMMFCPRCLGPMVRDVPKILALESRLARAREALQEIRSYHKRHYGLAFKAGHMAEIAGEALCALEEPQ